MSKGFTLIELLVVTSIIVLMTVLILSNYRAGDQQLALRRSASKLAQDLRRAEELALSSKEFGDEVPAGYGIYFDISNPTHYILFAELDGEQGYSDDSEKVEEITLEGRVSLDSLSPGSPLTIVFSPPNPTTTISPDADSVSIVIKVGLEQKTVQVNKVGLIAVE